MLYGSALHPLQIASRVANALRFPTLASMYAAFEADFGDNTYNTLNVEFLPSSVDTVNNTLDLVSLGFPEFDQASSDFKGTPVYFSTTGTLPSPLMADTPYYLSEVSGGYAIYPESTTGDIANLPTGLATETPMVAQNYLERTNRITLTTQGTGVHTIYTDVLLETMLDRLGTGYTNANRNALDRHSAMIVKTDAHGDYIHMRHIGRDLKTNYGGTYNLYGISPVQGPSALRGASRSESAGKRTVWSTHVARLVVTNNRSVRKNIIAPASVNTTTGEFTYSDINGKFAEGNLVKFKTATAGLAIPTGFTAGTSYWVHVTGTNTYTLHPTLADSVANTNKIVPTTQGTGKFVIYAPQRVGDFHRQIFFMEHLEPNGGQNILSPFVHHRGPAANGIITASNWTQTDNGSSPENGDIQNLKGFGELAKIELWFAPEAVRPKRQDTGADLADGTYWVTNYIGGSTYARLHDTLADAEACSGRATNECTNAEMVKFDNSTTVVGECLVYYNDEAAPWSLNADWTSTAANPMASGPDVPLDFDENRLPINDGEPHVFTFLIDNNDPDEATPLAKLWIDGRLQRIYELTGTKGTSDASFLSNSPSWTYLNSAALHVPFCGDMYATYLGSSAGAVDHADIEALHAYARAKFNIPLGPLVPIVPANLTLPVITGSAIIDQTLTVSDGTWDEYPVGTKTYQWQADGVDISGATNNTLYLLAAQDLADITCEVTSTNSKGATTVESAAVGPVVGIPTAPFAQTAGTISGNLNEGFTLTLTPTVWGGYPAGTPTIQWRRNGVDIGGATSTTYVTEAADVGATITCYETSTNASGLGNSTSNGLGPIIAAPTYEAESNTLFGRMSPSPGGAEKYDINALILALKTAGVWAKLDMLQVYAVPEAQHALLDWKESTRTASIVTSGGNPNFSADNGYVGTVFSGGGYIDTGYNPTTYGGAQFLQNDAHKGVWIVAQGTDSTGANGAAFGVTRAYTIPRTVGTAQRTSVLNNSANNFTTIGLADARHHYVESRAASGNFAAYLDGAVVNASHTSTSVTRTNANWKALGREGSTTVTCHRVGIIHAGGALTAQQIEDMYAAFHVYLTARGVANLPPFSPGSTPVTNGLTVDGDALYVGSEDLIVN